MKWPIRPSNERRSHDEGCADIPNLDCKGPTPSTAPLGQPGCCDGGTVAPSLDCSGLNDSAKIWIRVDNPQKLACVPYQLDYHF